MTLAERLAEIRDATITNFNTALRVGQALLDINNSEAIDPASHGAAGDGVTSDNAALLSAISAGVAAGLPVNGRGKTYGVTGNLALIANAWLQDITLKQLTPSGGSRRTLTSSSASNIKLVRVTVNRNGDGTNGSIGSDAGIWIDGGSGHYFEDVEVYGNDMGTGFVITNASQFDMVRVYAHDIKYTLGADPGDDRVQGIWITACSDFRNLQPKVHDLGGTAGAWSARWGRAIVYGGCSEFTVDDPRAWNVDQGHDVTGGPALNQRFSITGGLMRDCYSFGFKFANTARDVTVTGAIAERCGLAGFVVSGGTVALANSNDIDFNGCVAYDIGSNGSWGTTYGFRVEQNGATPGEPRGIRFLNCKAHDRQGVPTMDYGFHNDVAANTDGRYNEVINCRSIGHITAPFQGMNQSRVDATRSSVSVGTGAWTLVAWDGETDLGAMYTPPSGQIFARQAGDYQITAGITFAPNAVGQRGIRLVGNGGAAITGASMLVNTAAAGNTEVSISWLKKMAVGDEIRVEVWQSSGGGLNILGSAVVQQVG